MHWLSFLVLLGCHLEMDAQGWIVNTYTVEDGLASEYLYGITSFDDQIIIGSDQGLIGFDGKDFDFVEGFSRVYPIHLYNYSSDVLYISTHKNGIFKWDEEGVQQVQSEKRNFKIIGVKEQYLLFNNRTNQIHEPSLLKYTESFQKAARSHLNGGRIYISDQAVYGYKDHQFKILDWDGDVKGVYDFDQELTELVKIDKQLFVGHSSGEVSILDTKNHQSKLPFKTLNPIWKIIPYGHNSVIVVSRNGQSHTFHLLTFSEDFDQLLKATLIHENEIQVNGIHIESGIIYLSTFGHGLHVIRPSKFAELYTFPDNLPRIESFVPEDDGSFYCKSANSIFHIEQGKIKPLLKDRAIGIFKDQKGKVYLSGSLGLYDDHLTLISHQDVISYFQMDSVMLLGYGKYSFFNMNLQTGKVDEYFSLSKSNSAYGKINCGAMKKEEVYLGTDNGIITIEENEGWVVTENSLLSDYFKGKKIEDLAFHDDTLVIVGDGMLFYSHDSVISEASILPWEVVVNKVAVLEKNTLLIGTNNGFYSKKDNELLHYHHTNGLQSNQVVDFYIDDLNTLYFMTSKGISFCHLDSMKTESPPQLLSTNPNFEFPKVTIPIRPAMVENQNDMHVQYKINEGIWTILEHKSLELHNLEPKDYSILIRAKYTNSEWSPEMKYQFVIHPNWHQTIYAKGLLATIFLGLLFYGFKWRLDKSEYQKKLLESEILKRKVLAQKISTLREEISQDFHDDIGNKIASIGSISNSLLNDDSAYDAQKLKAISNLSSEIYDNTRDFVWLLNPENNNVFSLCQYIRDYAEQYFELQDDIDFYYESNLTSNPVLSYEMIKNIVLTFKEIITNIVRHSMASKVILKVGFENENFYFEINDNGVGFTSAEMSKGNGLGNIKKRMAKIGAQVEMDSTAGVRYRITINNLAK